MNLCLAWCPWIRFLLCTGGLMVAWRTSAIKQIDSFFKQWHLRFVISNMQLCYANFPEILVFHCTGHTWNTFAWGSCLVSAFGRIALAAATLTSKGLFLLKVAVRLLQSVSAFKPGCPTCAAQCVCMCGMPAFFPAAFPALEHSGSRQL